MYSVSESDGAVEITLTVFPPPNDTTILRSVVFNTVDGTATGELYEECMKSVCMKSVCVELREDS